MNIFIYFTSEIFTPISFYISVLFKLHTHLSFIPIAWDHGYRTTGVLLHHSQSWYLSSPGDITQHTPCSIVPYISCIIVLHSPCSIVPHIPYTIVSHTPYNSAPYSILSYSSCNSTLYSIVSHTPCNSIPTP